MKLSTTVIKTLVVSMIFAFAGQTLADDWFSGTAEGDTLAAVEATWDTNVVGEVTVAESVLSIDLPTNTVVKLTPTSSESNKKTYVVVDGAVFTPTAVEDIDNSVVVDAQTALTVAYDENNATNYYAYIGGNWVKLFGVTPVEESVGVTIELDYSDPAQTNATFKVGGMTLHDESSNEGFPIVGAQRALGRIELAGYGSIHSVTTTVEAVANVTITPGTITYGADFTNVTITATVDGTGYDAATYTLTWNGSTVGTFTRDGNTISITAPIVFPDKGRESVEYVINVNGNAATNQTTVVADNRDWVTENKDSQHTTGTWSAGDVAYDGNVATVADNTYTASSCTTGDLVTITFENLVYTELSDLSVATPDGTQGAFALAEENDVKSFYILAKSGWTPAAWAGGTPSTNVAYTVEMAFNYTNNTYSVKVSDGTNYGSLSVNSATEFDICVESTKVTDFVFKGSGTMTGIKGVDSLGYMAKDSAGHWYATIDAATKSGVSEFTVLRDTDPAAPAGWKFVTEGGIMKLVKAAKGVFFMVY